MQELIHHLRTIEDGTLIALCVRPGDGRRTAAIRLANELAKAGEHVCYYSFSRSPTKLERTLDPAVIHPANFHTPTAGVWIIDDLTAWATTLTLADSRCTKIAILSALRRDAIRNGLRIVVTDTHARYTDRHLPIPDKGVALCDAVYELRKQATVRPFKSDRT